jgi:hypothetical protein
MHTEGGSALLAVIWVGRSMTPSSVSSLVAVRRTRRRSNRRWYSGAG